MADYIKREDFLKKWCESYCRPKQNCRDDCSFYDAITQFPAADVRENVRGSFVGDYDGYADGNPVYDIWSCSNCGVVFEDWDEEPTYNFCPNCGADMRGEKDD